MHSLFLCTGISALLALSSCKRNPIDRLVNPVAEGGVPQSSGVFTIYDDELKTAGGYALIPGPENQSINEFDHTPPVRSANAIRYTWNGQNVDITSGSVKTPQHLFAGLSFIVTPDGSTLSAASGKNLANFGYTTLRFYARGSLSAGTRLRIEGPSPGGSHIPARLELDSTQLTSEWKQFSLILPHPDLFNVKIFLTVSFQYEQAPRTGAPGNGGEVFLDDIVYVNENRI